VEAEPANPTDHRCPECSKTIQARGEAVATALRAATDALRVLAREHKEYSTLVSRRLAFLEKNQKKKRKASSTPGGLMKKVPVSGELLALLGQPEGTQMSRVDVVKSLNQYIKDHKLGEHGKSITPNAELAKLFGSTEPFAYINLQSRISPLMNPKA
jgi:chromatin remodeling complex protein RSC6